MLSYADDYLLKLILLEDDKLMKDGKEPKTRHLLIAMNVMSYLGFKDYVMGGVAKPHPVFKQIMTIIDQLFDKRDVAMGGHIGVYFFSDIFARIAVPLVYGRPRIDPIEFVEITPLRKRLLRANDYEYNRFIDQFCDAFDLDMGINDLVEPFGSIELCARYLKIGRLHMHAAAAIVTGGYDYRGAVQNAILATELSLKAVVAIKCPNSDYIKREYGHSLLKLASHLEQKQSELKFDFPRVFTVVGAMPSFVANRYEAEQPSRLVVGSVVISAQFVVAEVARALSGRNFRSGIQPSVGRVCP